MKGQRHIENQEHTEKTIVLFSVCVCVVLKVRKCFDLFLLIGTIYFYFNYGSMGLKIIDEWR